MKKKLLSAVAVASLITVVTASDGTTIESKVPVLKFSGTHYLGFVNSSPVEGDSTNILRQEETTYRSKLISKRIQKIT